MNRLSAATLAVRARRGLGWAVFVAGAGIELGHLVAIAHADAAA